MKLSSILLGVIMLMMSRGIGQEKLGRIDSASAKISPGSNTGSSLDSTKYYINIVPVDTNREERMPKYNPPEEGQFVAVEHQPKPLKQVHPKYPHEAVQSGIEGTVWLNCLIGADGKVTNVRVARADNEIFVKPSIEAARQWQFSPAQVHGKPVAVWATIPFRFRLDNVKK